MIDEEEDNIGFVVCAACGARIKANRERCLRCEEPLVAWQKPEVLPSWLQRMGGGNLVFGAVALLALLIVIVLYVDSRSNVSSDVAQPVGVAPAAPRVAVQAAAPAADAGSPPAASIPVPVSSIEPATFLDAQRRGTADFSTGDFAAARGRFEQALDKRPNDPEILNNLGLTLERLGQIDAAIARFERAAQARPQEWSYHFNLAHAVSQRGDWDRAVREYRAAADLFPTDYATQYNLAMTLHRKGDEVGAIPEFQKAIDLAPNEPTFHLSLGASLEKAGRFADAQREFQTYVDMAPTAPDAQKVKSHIQQLNK